MGFFLPIERCGTKFYSNKNKTPCHEKVWLTPQEGQEGVARLAFIRFKIHRMVLNLRGLNRATPYQEKAPPLEDVARLAFIRLKIHQ